MKNVMPARTSMGIRTVFNILGPLTNPANAKGQIVGVYDAGLTEKLVEVLSLIGLERAFVVHGVDGLDEISILGETKVSELKDGEIYTYTTKPEDYGLERGKAQDLLGGDAAENAQILRGLLEGIGAGPKRDMVLLNAAAGIVCGGKAETVEEGIEVATESLKSGKALDKLDELIAYCQRTC